MMYPVRPVAVCASCLSCSLSSGEILALPTVNFTVASPFLSYSHRRSISVLLDVLHVLFDLLCVGRNTLLVGFDTAALARKLRLIGRDTLLIALDTLLVGRDTLLVSPEGPHVSTDLL